MNSKQNAFSTQLAFCLVALLVSGSCRAIADVPATNTPIQTLDFEAYMERTMAWAKNTGRLGRHAAMARAMADEARSQSWPHLNIRAGGRYETQNSEILPEADGDFGDTFLQLPQNVLRRRIAGMGMVCAGFFESRATCVVMARAQRAYAGFLRANANLDMAEAQMILADTLETAWQRAPAEASKDASLAERRQESMAIIRNQPLLFEQAELEQALAAKRLFTMACISDSRLAVSVMPLPDYVAAPGITAEGCMAWALSKRGDLLALHEQIRIQQQAIRLARLARLPSPAISFGYRDSSDVDSDNAIEGMYLKAMLKMPIWDAGEIGAQTAKLAAERTRTVMECDELQAEIVSSTAKACAAWMRAVEAYRETAARMENPDESRRRADIRRALGDLSHSEHQTELFKISEREHEKLRANLACYEAEADLLEAMQADRAAFAAGLKEQP